MTMQEDLKMPIFTFSGNPFERLFNQNKINSRLAIYLFAVALIIFLLIALLFSFKDRILERFFPKQKTQAAACTSFSEVPSNRTGFVFTGGDLEQAITSLETPLYLTNDLNLGPKKSIFTIAKYTQNFGDPLNLRLLMENNLSNADFKGSEGQTPVGWNVSGQGAALIDVETVVQNTASKGTSVRLSNNSDQTATQISQIFKKSVTEGQFIVFGVWIKAAKPEDVKVIVQNSVAPYQQFGSTDTSNIKSNKWTYTVGFGKVPAGVSNFQLSISSLTQGGSVSFESASVAALTSQPSQALSDLVLSHCGGVWMIDDGIGFEQTYFEPFMNPLPMDIYALIYNQFYNQIKSIDPSAKVLPGGIMGSPVGFDNKNGYSPKSMLDNFRLFYKGFFGIEPPIDILAIRYLATDQNKWSGAKDLEDYLTNLSKYMDNVVGWKGIPIWISRLGVSKNAPNGGVDFIQAAMKYLNNNNLNVEKWFWYDTCGVNPQLSGLFESSNKICFWPMKLNALGKAYVKANIAPTNTPTPSPTVVTVTSTPSATIAPTLTPTPAAIPISTSSATSESTSGGTSTP